MANPSPFSLLAALPVIRLETLDFISTSQAAIFKMPSSSNHDKAAVATGSNTYCGPSRRKRRRIALTPDTTGASLSEQHDGGATDMKFEVPSGPEDEVGNNVETVAEDDVCPICQLLIYRPVTTSCRHTMCESCMAHWADVSITTQMQIVDVDEEAVPFNPVSGLEARCPMCRTQTSASLDRARERNLQNEYPQTYSERKAEEEQSGTNNQSGEIQTLTLSIGNQHRLTEAPSETSGNIHEWNFFVRPSRTDIIEEVHIHLHPTFRPPKVIRTRPPYEIRRLGWGYFTIVAYVMLKAGYSWGREEAGGRSDGAEEGMLGLEWMLDFDRFGGRGSMGRLRLKVKNQRAWEDVSDQEEEEERLWSRTVRQYQRDGHYVPPDEEL